MQLGPWPENVSMYGGRNLQCSPDCVCITDLIYCLPREGAQICQHVLSNGPKVGGPRGLAPNVWAPDIARSTLCPADQPGLIFLYLLVLEATLRFIISYNFLTNVLGFLLANSKY